MSTIAAISTPHASGGVSMIRISGEDALKIAEGCFKRINGKTIQEMAGYTCAYGSFIDETGAVLDDGIVTVYRAPHSYTGENVVELSCHGGIYVTKKLLETVVKMGADYAQAGEFTKRAFINGKMNLTQAEAVMDVISAAGKQELSFAHAQQKGALSQKVSEISGDLIRILGNLAAWADYPEEDIPEVSDENLCKDIETVIAKTDKLIQTYEYGKILRSGVSCVIVGKPNVGKSTLFNLLSGEKRSIVTEIAGTTRDIVEQEISLGSVRLRLCDTAGIHDTQDKVEKIGIEMAQERLEQADLVLLVIDASEEMEEDELDILQQVPDKPVICLVNKADLADVRGVRIPNLETCIPFSAKTGAGLEQLQREIETMFYQDKITANMGFTVNLRQKKCLEIAKQLSTEAIEGLKNGLFLDAVTVLLDEALDALLTLNGEKVTDAVVNDVFSRFCVGK